MALYAEAGVGRSPMYVVAEGIEGESRCPGGTVLTGWLMPDDFGRLVLRSALLFRADCDGKLVRTARPLAAIQVGERRFWVLRDFGYEDERAIIAEFRPRAVDYVLVVDGGSC